MKFKKKRPFELVVIDSYEGSYEPQNPKEGDFWINDYTQEYKIYLYGAWRPLDLIHRKQTGYTIEEIDEMGKRELKEEFDLDKFKKGLKLFLRILEEEV